MKNIDKFNLSNKKSLGFSFLVLVTSVLLLGLMVFSYYSNQIKDTIKNDAKITLENVSSQNVTNMRNDILAIKKFLNLVAENIESKNNYDIEYILKYLKLFDESNEFYDMGIIDENGICYTTLGEELNVSTHDYFLNGMKGISGISTAHVSEHSKEVVNIFTVPIYAGSEVKLILTATYEGKKFSNMINISSFEGNGKSMVIDSHGNLVTKAQCTDVIPNDSLHEADNSREHILSIISSILDKSNECFITYEYDNEQYLAYYDPIGINDWYLLTYVPRKYLYKNINIINNMIFSESILIYTCMLILLILFYKEYIGYQKRISKVIFVDDLTLEKNYEYLKLYFKYLRKKDKEQKYLVVIDIDKFKIINLMHGTNVGDKLLKYIPSTFKELFPEDKIFRCGGDMFVGILNGTCKSSIVDKLIRLQYRIKEDIEKKVILPMNLSFGVCGLYEFEDLHSIYNNALIAKNEIKGNVNQKINFFNEGDKNKLLETRAIEAKFIDSLKNQEFEVWYQPKYHLSTNEFYGAEALIRWREKDGTFISPGKFIPVFENSGQILELDETIIEMIFQDINEMKSQNLKIKPISINLSRVHVEHLGILDKIKELLDKYKVNPSYVSFEITESALIDNSKMINKIITDLHHMGFEVDIDDYGTGNSTLNSLYSSDFDTLKLDKSFIDNIGNSKTDIILKSTIAMANELKMKIVAEGVETQEQLSFLKENHCTIAQGYYFSKPLDKEKYFDYLRKKGLE